MTGLPSTNLPVLLVDDELEAMVFDAVSHHKARKPSMKTFETYICPGEPAEKDGVIAAPGEEAARVGPSSESETVLFPEQLPTLSKATDELVAEAMRRCDGNQTLAARLLGISRPTLSKRLKRSKP